MKWYIFDFCRFQIALTVALKGHSRFFIDITIRAPIKHEALNQMRAHTCTNNVHSFNYEDTQHVLKMPTYSN